MDQELIKLEQMNAKELELIKQVYEQKISYLNTKVYMMTKELESKTSELNKKKRASIAVHEDPIQEDNLIEIEKAQTNSLITQSRDQMNQEIEELRQSYENELNDLQKQIQKRDLMIQQLKQEINMYKNTKNQNLDEMKVEYLSNLIDITGELKIILQ